MNPQQSNLEIIDSNSESPSPPLQEPCRNIHSPSPPLQQPNRNIDSPPRASIDEPLKKFVTPDRLRVPIAFKHPERYRSPTDAMMSPITKGLLARTRKPSGSLIPPSFNHTKIQELHKPESGLSSASC